MIKQRTGIGGYIFSKLVRLFILLVAVMIITFILMELSPIDPVTAYVGANTKVGAEQRALIAEQWGLDQPPLLRFWAWFSNMLKGDWGTSIVFRRPVLEVIAQKSVSSLALMAIAWVISGILGFFLGVLAGVKEGKLADRIIKTYCHIMMSTPSFWLGILIMMIFAVKLGWLPVGLSVPIGIKAEDVSFADRAVHIIMPAITLAMVSVSSICMHTREKTIDTLNSEFVLFAKARGESMGSIVSHHVLRNASPPAVTVLFLSFSELFGGAVFVEQVFSYPGLGGATVQAGLRGDIPLLMGITIISVVFVYTGNTIADLLYRVIDPRIREGRTL